MLRISSEIICLLDKLKAAAGTVTYPVNSPCLQMGRHQKKLKNSIKKKLSNSIWKNVEANNLRVKKYIPDKLYLRKNRHYINNNHTIFVIGNQRFFFNLWKIKDWHWKETVSQEYEYNDEQRNPLLPSLTVYSIYI